MLHLKTRRIKVPSSLCALGAAPILCFVVLCFVAACARDLKSEKDIGLAPGDFEQKIENISVAQLEKSYEESNGELKPIKDAPASPVAPQSDADTKLASPNLTSAQTLSPAKGKKSAAKTPSLAKTPVAKAPVAAALDEPTWVPSKWPYGIGEKFTLLLRYGPIPAGTATMEVGEPKIVEGEPTLHYIGHVKSSSTLDLFYKVDDTMESWVGISDHLPRRQEIRQLESAFWGLRVVVFDQKNHMARFYSNTTKKNGVTEEVSRVDALTPFTQDVLGALFFYRFINNPESVTFPVHDRFKNWNNTLNYMGTETIRVRAGEFRTRHYKMLPRVTGYLKPKGDVELWLRDDDTRLMIQFKAKIRVGSVTGELMDYQPGTLPNFPMPIMKTPTKAP